jgi:hypothetical protein
MVMGLFFFFWSVQLSYWKTLQTSALGMGGKVKHTSGCHGGSGAEGPYWMHPSLSCLCASLFLSPGISKSLWSLCCNSLATSEACQPQAVDSRRRSTAKYLEGIFFIPRLLGSGPALPLGTPGTVTSLSFMDSAGWAGAFSKEKHWRHVISPLHLTGNVLTTWTLRFCGQFWCSQLLTKPPISPFFHAISSWHDVNQTTTVLPSAFSIVYQMVVKFQKQNSQKQAPLIVIH